MVLVRIASVMCVLAVLFACSAEGETGESTEPSGEEVYNLNCVTCHGSDGTLCFGGAPDLTKSQMPVAERVELINTGKGVMISYKTLLSEAEIEAVATYSVGFYK